MSDAPTSENTAPNGEKTPLLPTSRKDSAVSDRSVRFGDDVAPCASERRSASGSSPPGISTSSVASTESSRSSGGSVFGRFLRRSSSSFYENLTHSERELALERPGVGQAAFLIRDAVLGEVENPAEGAYDPYVNEDDRVRNVVSILCRRICAMRSLRHVLHLAVWLLVVVSFLEPPSWCRSFDRVSLEQVGDDDGFNDNYRCEQILTKMGPPADNPSATEEVEYYPNFGAIMLTPNQALTMEIACMALIVAFLLLRIGRDGISLIRFLRKGPARVVRIVELVAVFGILCGIMITSKGDKRYLAPFWRILLLLAYSQESRRELKTLVNLIPEVFYVLVLLFVVVVFWAWIGVVLFYGTDEGDQHFSDLIEAMWSLWICVTTANYPDVMMPAYNKNRAVTVYFVVFMIVTFFFMMNVILASVVNAYDNELEMRKQVSDVSVTRNLKRAFKLLTDKGKVRINHDTVMALFLILNQDFPEFRTIPKDEANLLFAILDKDGSSTISEEEFLNFGNVLLLEFERTSSYITFIERRFPRLYRSKGYQTFSEIIRSHTFELVVDGILILNAVVIGIQSYPLLAGRTVAQNPHVADGEIDTFWEAIETLFTCIYTLEILCKIMVLGWKRFHESGKNLFDMIITCLSILATAYVYYPNKFSNSLLIRYVVMARVLRLSRLLTAMRPFQIIANISIDILPMAKNVVLLLFCIMYAFAALGMTLFGGMISRDPADPLSYLVLNTDFSDNEYWANNFNDMLSGMNVLFNLLVVNNWTECADGFEAVTQSKYTRLFFLAFHILGVVLVNNLVIAFIVNSFIEQWDRQQERDQREDVEGEAAIEGRQALFDAEYVTGTKTGLGAGMFIARIGRRAHNRQKQQVLLKSMFTRDSSHMDDSERDLLVGATDAKAEGGS